MSTISDGRDLRYDAACKQVLAEKEILAYILKYCVAEYKDLERSEIKKYIQGRPQISETVVEDDDLRIESERTEDRSLAEGTVYYDIRFTATAPAGDGEIELIINVEAQNRYNPGYPLLKRAMYYCSRLISSQYGTVFTKSHYEKIKKVYSIWICTDVPKRKAGTISKYAVHEENIYGTAREPREHYDLLTAVIVCLGENENPVEERSMLLEMLNYLMLNNDDSYQQKQQRLDEEFAIQMTPPLEKGVAKMCNLSEGVFERGELRRSIEIALNMLKERVNLDFITRMTKLSADEVRQIAKDNGLTVV